MVGAQSARAIATISAHAVLASMSLYPRSCVLASLCEFGLTIFFATTRGAFIFLLLLSLYLKLYHVKEGLCLCILSYYSAIVSKALRQTLRNGGSLWP